MHPCTQLISPDLYLLRTGFHIRANTNTFLDPNSRVVVKPSPRRNITLASL